MRSNRSHPVLPCIPDHASGKNRIAFSRTTSTAYPGGKPVAYMSAEKGFWSLELGVTGRAHPAAETECLRGDGLARAWPSVVPFARPYPGFGDGRVVHCAWPGLRSSSGKTARAHRFFASSFARSVAYAEQTPCARAFRERVRCLWWGLVCAGVRPDPVSI